MDHDPNTCSSVPVSHFDVRHAAIAAEDKGCAVVAEAQQVLGEVQAGSLEPLGTGER